MSSALPNSRFVLDRQDRDAITSSLKSILQTIGEPNFQEPFTIEIGSEILDYYSLCFPVALVANSGSTLHLFCKCPKAESPPFRPVLPFTTADKELASNEYEALRMLADLWNPGAISGRYVKALCFATDVNCLVLERVFGEEFYRVARRYCSWLGVGKYRKSARAIPRILAEIGSSLGKFHSRTMSDGSNILKVSAKIDLSLARLSELGVDARKLELLRCLTHAQWAKLPSYAESEVCVLKGLDIRNVLVTNEGHFTMIDPGKIRRDAREADLARFIVSLRLLYWGSREFIFGARPAAQLERRFLDAYADQAQYSKAHLRWYVVKELLKHWVMAIGALKLKNFPPFVEAGLRRFYVDRFFFSEIRRESR